MSEILSNAVMAWSECDVAIAHTADNETMADELTSVGAVKDKSATLEPSDGDTLEIKRTGGSTYAKEVGEGGYTLTVRVIEPSDDLLSMLGLGSLDANTNEFRVSTHVVEGKWSVRVTPKNAGAIGIKAPKTNITYKPGWSEEEGNYADLVFEILKGKANYWYSRFKKNAANSVQVVTVMYVNGSDVVSTLQGVAGSSLTAPSAPSGKVWTQTLTSFPNADAVVTTEDSE